MSFSIAQNDIGGLEASFPRQCGVGRETIGREFAGLFSGSATVADGLEMRPSPA